MVTKIFEDDDGCWLASVFYCFASQRTNPNTQKKIFDLSDLPRRCCCYRQWCVTLSLLDCCCSFCSGFNSGDYWREYSTVQ